MYYYVTTDMDFCFAVLIFSISNPATIRGGGGGGGGRHRHIYFRIPAATRLHSFNSTAREPQTQSAVMGDVNVSLLFCCCFLAGFCLVFQLQATEHIFHTPAALTVEFQNKHTER